jgi:hypothetical protein
MRIHVDPGSGQLTEPPAGAVSPPVPQATDALRTFGSRPVEIPSPVLGGGTMVDLEGRFRKPLIGIVEPDGSVVIQHLERPPKPDAKP